MVEAVLLVVVGGVSLVLLVSAGGAQRASGVQFVPIVPLIAVGAVASIRREVPMRRRYSSSRMIIA
jgi:hypothetical protein